MVNKIFIYFLLFLLLPPLLSSCSLDEDPRDQIAEEEIYTSAQNLYKNAVATFSSFTAAPETYEF